MGMDVNKLMQQVGEMQEQMQKAQDEVEHATVESSAGGGMVTAVVNGKLELVHIRIDPTLLQTPDVDMLQDLVVAAVNEGIRAAQKMMSDEMGKLTGGLGIKLPGMP